MECYCFTGPALQGALRETVYMLWRGKVCGLALGGATAALALSALAQQAETPYAVPFALPAGPAPVPIGASSDAGPPAAVPTVADLHVSSTALGICTTVV